MIASVRENVPGMNAERAGGSSKKILVLGAGTWVRDQYAPALKPYREARRCGAFILDDSGLRHAGRAEC